MRKPLSSASFLLALLSLLAAPVQAQVSYYAGTPADAPNAQGPTLQGWSQSGSASAYGLSPDPDFPLHAWQLNDTGPGHISYHATTYVNTNSYEVEFLMRPLAGRMRLEIDSGDLLSDDVFLLSLELIGQDIHVTEQISSTTLICPGASGSYHSYRFTAGGASMQLTYDGQSIGFLPSSFLGLGQPGEGLSWGTFDSVPGRFRIHNIWMSNSLPLTLGSYYCSPANLHSGGVRGRIITTGSPFWWHNNVLLEAVNLPLNQFGYFLTSASTGFLANPGGSQGNLCLSGNIGRFSSNVMSSGPSGSFALPINLTALPTTPSASVLAGDSWNFQAWFRDQNPTPTSNFTNATTITFL